MTSSVFKCLDSKYLERQRNFDRVVIPFGTCALILIVTIYEVLIIFVKVFSGFYFYLNCAIATFLAFNMIGNLIACSRIDTSISLIKQRPPKGLEPNDNWQFCKKCRAMTPPRTRHCDTCNTCILKQDHHCYFTGRCIGYYNYRYFVAFLAYVAIGTAYATSINIIYFWWLHSQTYFNFYRMICFAFPAFIFLQWTWDGTAFSFDWNSLHIILFLINAVVFLIVTIVLCFHIRNSLSGATGYKQNDEQRLYKEGSWRRNIEMGFVKNLFKMLLLPFINNELPYDGIVHSTEALEEVSV